MKPIKDLRAALDRIPGSRHRIISKPPHVRSGITTGDRIAITGAMQIAELEKIEAGNNMSVSLDEKAAWIDYSHKLATQYECVNSFDALAWYVSFHNSSEEWGIYIPMSSVHYLADRLFKSSRVKLERRINLAFNILLQHERFHFWTDYAATQYELIYNTPLHAPLRERLHKINKYNEIEEALANAYMLNSVSGMLSPSQLERLRADILGAPPGYCDALHFAEDRSIFLAGLDEVMKSFVGLHAVCENPSFPVGSFQWRVPYLDENQFSFEACPVIIILDDQQHGLPPFSPALITQIPIIEETRNFMKKLSRLPKALQESWMEKKQEVGRKVPAYPEFEKLKNCKTPTFSIRLNDGYRAHLRPHPKFGFERWLAIEVGTHTQMGHD